MLRFYRDNWYNVGAVLFVALAFFMGFWGDRFSPLETILVYSFMALLAHQYEEYGWPGGGGLVINGAMYGERTAYDRYPGNTLSMTLVNTVGAYTFYLLAVLFPAAIWLGLAVMFFGFFQILGHGVAMNIKAKTLYNPGLATTLFLFVPLGIYYITYIHRHQLVSGMDYLYGGLAFIASVLLVLVLPIRALMNRNSPYPMSAEDMAKFNMREKLRGKGLID
ncbi:HXXEE domain-containing protein [Ensifer adhaerens]|uniref:HXXEE domain-containing protein n=1 Tax=Ensifer adhaerens TaxID=106592 RepID=UPI003CFF1728